MRQDNRISKHVSYKEATKSKTAIQNGIDNTPDTIQLANMRNVAENIFEQVRGRFCVPIFVSSFFRSEELARFIPGSSTKSQHCKGEAMDLDADVYGMITNRDIFDYIKDNLEFDQLIWEHGDDKDPAWVHVSLKRNGYNRKEILVAYKERQWTGKFKTKYKYYEG